MNLSVDVTEINIIKLIDDQNRPISIRSTITRQIKNTIPIKIVFLIISRPINTIAINPDNIQPIRK